MSDLSSKEHENQNKRERIKNLIAYANIAHNFGFVPIPLLGKTPRVKEWPKIRNDPEEDRKDFFLGILPKNVRRISHLLDANAADNIGIITGEASGVVVFDIDNKNNGIKNWEELIRANGNLPETFIISTGSGGYHYYFKYESDLKNLLNSYKILGFSFDFKTNGGMVVFPGSVVGKGEYRVYSGYEDNKIILAEMPVWLKKILIMDRIEKREKIKATYEMVEQEAESLGVDLRE